MSFYCCILAVEFCITMKSFRQNTILEIVDGEPITSQEQLRKRLQIKGIEATQATLSRDIRDLGLVKRVADHPGVTVGLDRLLGLTGPG